MAVISLTDAKQYLILDDGVNDDAIIQSFINASVNYIATYTCYYLDETNLDVYTNDCGTVEVYAYPFTINTAQVERHYKTLSSTLVGKRNSTISLKVGFTNINDVPPMLVVACKKLIHYMYENRDMYPVSLPTDVQYLINQFRRSPTI